MLRLSGTIVLAFFASLALAGGGKLIDSQNRIDLSVSSTFNQNLVNHCTRSKQGQQAFECKVHCGTVHDKLQGFTTHISRGNVSVEVIKSSFEQFFKGVMQCAQVWSPNKPPIDLKPYADLIDYMRAGNHPLPPAAGQQSGNQYAFAPPPGTVKAQSQQPVPAPRSAQKSSAPAVGIRNSAQRVIDEQPKTPLEAVKKMTRLNYANACYEAATARRADAAWRTKCERPCNNIAAGARHLMGSTQTQQSVTRSATSLSGHIQECGQYLNPRHPYIQMAGGITLEILKRPTVFDEWRARGKATITAQKDSDPTAYVAEIMRIANAAQAFCGPRRADCVQQCAAMKDLADRLGVAAQANDLSAMQEPLSLLPQTVMLCKVMSNSSPELPALTDLLAHVKANPNLFLTASSSSKALIYQRPDNDFEWPLQLSGQARTTTSRDNPHFSGIHQLGQMQLSCFESGAVDCLLACANAVVVSDAVIELADKGAHSRLPVIEQLQDEYIRSCHQLQPSGSQFSAAGSTTAALALANYDFAASTGSQSLPPYQGDNLDLTRLRYPPEPNAPYDTFSPARGRLVSMEFKQLADAMLTVHNYCLESGSQDRCPPLALAEWLEPASRVLDPSLQNPQIAADLEYIVAAFAPSHTIERHNKMLEYWGVTVGTASSTHKLAGPQYMNGLPHKVQPPKIRPIMQLAEAAADVNPGFSNRKGMRFYCGVSGRAAANPFYPTGQNNTSCEYLSALYYRDFDQLVRLESLFAEPIVRRMQKDISGPNNPWAIILGAQTEAMANNMDQMSMMPFLIPSYIIDFSNHRERCLPADTQEYTFAKTTVTEYKNRWGHTTNSSKNVQSNTYRVAREWVPILDRNSLQLSAEGLGMYEMFDKNYSRSAEARAAETEYGTRRPGIGSVTVDINSRMRLSSCDDPVMIKLDQRLREFANYRSGI
ncbi:hypothetical protein EYC98_13245 [Halieaceae bacterium IMCC14734]|uniref:Uncharacterized protein n=1 Tax=Candidatus Litorirhabdus singularis TaxID=2518993 RepID=A0ABT3THM9_9GAMM|nr:hypothetical protein [Candidatus Litorirhabdus singularis]MCX2981823.1 hypothetical protein [Candidatus Litorirhabdus singularis]